jgi:hypothetical protein
VRNKMRELFGAESSPWEENVAATADRLAVPPLPPANAENTSAAPSKAQPETLGAPIRLTEPAKAMAAASVQRADANNTASHRKPPPPPPAALLPRGAHLATQMLDDLPPLDVKRRHDGTKMVEGGVIARAKDEAPPPTQTTQLLEEEWRPKGKAEVDRRHDQTKVLRDGPGEASSSFIAASAGDRSRRAAPAAQVTQMEVVRSDAEGVSSRPPPKSSGPSTQQVAARAALLGAFVIVLFVAFVFVAPWRKQSAGPKKEMLPVKATVEEKKAFVEKWCPKNPCLAELSGKAAEDGYAQRVDRCYRRCYGE